MSTRANIKVTDKSGGVLWFYRHSDGYPEGALPTLEKFLDLVKSGKIRNNISQASGWLVVLGAEEYGNNILQLEHNNNSFSDWKVGAIEPTTEQHGDIEYLYTIDLEKLSIDVKQV